MTEYITKEQAEKIAESAGLDDCQPHWASTEQYIRAIQRAINLAFSEKLPELEKQFLEQRLEVVGYKNRFSGAIVTNIPSWAVERESTPLYALKSSVATDFTEGKGDSK